MLGVALIRERFEALSPHLDERGYGGIAAVSWIAGIAAGTVGRGLNELAARRRGWSRPRPPFGRAAKRWFDGPEASRLNGLVEPEASRSDVAVALDLQESAPGGDRTRRPGAMR
jgi:hypothetical protein